MFAGDRVGARLPFGGRRSPLTTRVTCRSCGLDRCPGHRLSVTALLFCWSISLSSSLLIGDDEPVAMASLLAEDRYTLRFLSGREAGEYTGRAWELLEFRHPFFLKKKQWTERSGA